MPDRPATNNAAEARLLLSSLVTLAIATVAYLLLVTVWHYAMPQHRVDDKAYGFTNALVPSLLWLLIVFACIAGALGYLTNRKLPVAFGLILPFPIALWIEISRDPTSHNLFPFEIILGWIPAFLVALLAAYVGARIRRTSRV